MVDKSFVFVVKPPTYIPHDDIDQIVFDRLSQSQKSNRNFDIIVHLKDRTKHHFSNIDHKDLAPFFEFLVDKKLPIADQKNVRRAAGQSDSGTNPTSGENLKVVVFCLVVCMIFTFAKKERNE
jgi:hypothetical protein